jgi:hypothetical protein
MSTKFNMCLSHKVLTKFGTVTSVTDSDITILASRVKAHFQNKRNTQPLLTPMNTLRTYSLTL